MSYEFIKMNGAGNDFVIFDARAQAVVLTAQMVREISSRGNTVTRGCDQLIIIEKSEDCDVFMRIYNADGGEVDACGNATRCVAYLLEKELGRLPLTIQTNAGVLYGVSKQKLESGDEYVLVDMGRAKFGWEEIPLALPLELAAQRVTEVSGLANPIFVNMGNPHVVFFLSFEESGNIEDDWKKLEELDIVEIGSALERNKEIFPKAVNVSVAVVSDKYNIYSKVWERGAGLTKACGTAACAMLAAANKLDGAVRETVLWFQNSYPPEFVHVKMENNGHILLGGEVKVEFKGIVEL